MPSTRNIRRRIRSVRNTAQITRAMQMVAASKMRRAQEAAVNGRAYAEQSIILLAHAARSLEDFEHPLLEVRPTRRRAVIMITTDRGLCGGLNANLMREATRFDTDTTLFLAAGRKGAQFLARTKRRLVAEFTYSDRPTFAEALAMARTARQMFLEGEVDRVEVLYPRFVNTLTQKPEVRPLLPMKAMWEEALTGKAAEAARTEEGVHYLFEPDAKAVMAHLLQRLLIFQVLQYLQETKASEHSARMVAMKNATENAEQLIKDLTLTYNKIRQASITSEILDIAVAQMAIT
ncbi:MAG: ATP synthase F1 subunit gamma [Verrucomicrobia bacterium]|nr:MAG: ATP synthase F1 subunit gamma [Verrucomicrobiota bacterium]